MDVTYTETLAIQCAKHLADMPSKAESVSGCCQKAPTEKYFQLEPSLNNMVGEPGFEPGTSSSRTKRATELRHSPKSRTYRL